MNQFFDLVKVIFALVSVLALFYLLMKFLKNKQLYNQLNQMTILEKCYLGKDKLLCLIKVVDQVFLVSVTKQEINLIKEVELPDEVELTSNNNVLNLFKKGKDK